MIPDFTPVSKAMTHTTPKFIIFTWGCQMNEDDSEQIAGLLMRMGYAPTSAPEEADVAVLVTCSVRAKPEEKAKSLLGRLARVKREKPDMIIGVCGCMAQRLGESIRRGRPYVDIVIGTGAISRLPELICNVRETRRLATDLELGRAVPGRIERQIVGLKSFVPVMYGCDNYCAYCIVPYVRGHERSRSVEDIVAEVRDLARKGRKEITLLGQNVNSYGATLDPKVDFATLLEAVNDVDGIERIRFTTSHPKDLSDRLIEAMSVRLRRNRKVCAHIHLPVQSGDDAVLKRMNRQYTAAHYRERVAALRETVPDITITTDFLVGFPGETQDQFEHTLRLAEKIRFDSAFMFAFNPISGTAAEKMPRQVPKNVTLARLQKLIELQNKITCEINDSQVGRTFEVLVEGISPRDPSRVTGLTRQNKTVNFPGGESLIGKFVEVEATEGHLYGFVGRLRGFSS